MPMSLCAGTSKNSVLDPNGDGRLAVAVLDDRADRLQQGYHSVPFNVVAHRMLKDLAQGVAVMVAEVRLLLASLTCVLLTVRQLTGAAADCAAADWGGS